MASKKRILPDFDKPPVIEVVLGVQFEQIEKFCSVHTGLFWEKIKDKYPNIEEKPPLPIEIESFSDSERPKSEISYTDIPPLPRVWFLNDPGNRLVQLQNTRLIHNWREITPGENYPRFKCICKEYKNILKKFQEFVQEYNIGPIKANHWSVTYVNHIDSNQGWNDCNDFETFFTYWKSETTQNYLPLPENISFRCNFAFPEKQGRLHVSANPVLRKRDNKKILSLNLTARGRLNSSEEAEIFKGLELGHEWIVEGFTDLTTKKAHGIWKRKDK